MDVGAGTILSLGPPVPWVDPDTGLATEIDLGGASVPFGDGLVLRGKTLYVVQNFANAIAVFTLSPDYSAATFKGHLTDEDFRIPATAAAFGPWLYATNGRFDVCFPGICDRPGRPVVFPGKDNGPLAGPIFVSQVARASSRWCLASGPAKPDAKPCIGDEPLQWRPCIDGPLANRQFIPWRGWGQAW